MNPRDIAGERKKKKKKKITMIDMSLFFVQVLYFVDLALSFSFPLE